MAVLLDWGKWQYIEELNILAGLDSLNIEEEKKEQNERETSKEDA